MENKHLCISAKTAIWVFAGRDVLRQPSWVNLFFRVVEIVFFLGIGILLLSHDHRTIGLVHMALSVVYCGLFYFEKSLRPEELLSFHHTGVTIPGIPDYRFLLWTDINHVESHSDSIEISTSDKKIRRFDLLHDIEFAELDQIHEFCRHYIGESPICPH